MTTKQVPRPGGDPGEAENSDAAGGQLSPLIVDDDSRGNRSPLRRALDAAILEANGTKLSMKDLTVTANDPFRMDTPANHRLGKWLANTAATLGLGTRQIHNRGLHYMLLGQPKPDGSTYVSDNASWTLLEAASGHARWLGYIPFDQITDQRNAPPVVRIFEEPAPYPFMNVGIDIEIPAAEDIVPKLGVANFTGTQTYKLVLVGEKSSLDAVLGPIAATFSADLYLPTGDISDTMIYQMARVGAEDGRPMVVLYFADCDPSDWNMAVAIARKLQAFKVLHFPELEFEVHRAALTPDQVREFDLPSTPLKAHREARRRLAHGHGSRADRNRRARHPPARVAAPGRAGCHRTVLRLRTGPARHRGPRANGWNKRSQ